MKVVHWIVALVGSVCIAVVLFATAFDWAVFSDLTYYDQEFEKYSVYSQVDMTKEDLSVVTNAILQYLKGEREDLNLTVNVDGQQKEFFNDQEKEHMTDVKNIFSWVYRVRSIFVTATLASWALFLLMKAPFLKIYPKAFQIVGGITLVVSGIFAFVVSRNFTGAFTKFHEIFFSNDLWQMDPAKDIMIRLFPEPFFADMAWRMGKAFGALLIIGIVVSLLMIVMRDVYESVEMENKK